MGKYDCIFFDLDGTITDSAEGILNSFNHALGSVGIKVEDKTILFQCIGPPLWDTFGGMFGLTGDKLQTALDEFKAYYKDASINECRVFDGVEELLRKLHESGQHTAVASSKNELFVKRIIEHFGLAHYFDFVAGSDVDANRLDKGDVVKYVLDSMGLSDPSRCVLVGDRLHDILGAKSCGLSSIGVLYGYGGLNELQEAGADYVFATTKELEEFFGV
jgi:phosphoglycolate phosphatase